MQCTRRTVNVQLFVLASTTFDKTISHMSSVLNDEKDPLKYMVFC